MRLPTAVGTEVARALRDVDAGTIASVSGVAGGCINNGCRVETDDGSTFFLKWNDGAPEGMFEAEMDGLEALRSAAADVDPACRPRIPRPIASSASEAPVAWLLMSWIPAEPPDPDSEARLGRGLAALHRTGGSPAAPDGAPFGWHRDNWIGSLPQSNTEHGAWSTFWRDERIGPQLALARSRGHLRDAVLDELLAVVPAALEGVTASELLHGDLWSGNRFFTEGGAPALVDPAVYRGDGEVDLAMSELFGGFGPDFHAAYREVRPVSAGYESHRRALYQLYYLLVHVNLFGGAYVQRTLDAARTVVAALR